MPTTSLLLDVDCLSRCLSFLSTTEICNEAALVCKLWSDAACHPNTFKGRKSYLRNDEPKAELIDFFKKFNITCFYTNSASWFNLLVANLSETMEELEFQESDVSEVHWETTEMPALHTLGFRYSLADLFKSRISSMPNLTKIDASFSADDYWIDQLITCTKLKHIDSLDEMTFQRAKDLFENLSLESLSISFDELDTDIWQELIKLDNFRENLKSISISQYGRGSGVCPDVQPDYQLPLKKLETSRRLDIHRSLLVYSQFTLEELEVDASRVDDPLFNGIQLPLLKVLRVYGAKHQDALILLSGCGRELKELEVARTPTDEIDKPSLTVPELSFPHLEKLEVDEVTVDFFTVLLGSRKGSKLKELRASDMYFKSDNTASDVISTWSPLLQDVHTVEQFKGPVELFRALPEETLPTLTEISLCYYYDKKQMTGSELDLNDSILSKLLASTKLENFNGVVLTSITADNALLKLLLQNHALRSIDLSNAELQAAFDVTLLEQCTNELHSVTLHSSLVNPEWRATFFEKVSMSGIYLTHLSMQMVPELIELFNSKNDSFTYSSLSIDVEPGYDSLETCPISERSFGWLIIEFKGTGLKYADLVLVSICICKDEGVGTVSIDTDQNPETFFPAPYNVKRKDHSDYDDIQRDALKQLIPEVLAKITGSSEEKKQEIQDAILDSTYPLFEELVSFSYKFDTCDANTWDKYQQNVSLKEEADRLKHKIAFLENLLDTNNIPYDPITV